MSSEQFRRRDNPPNLSPEEAWRLAVLRNQYEDHCKREQKLTTLTGAACEGRSTSRIRSALAIVALSVVLCTSFTTEAPNQTEPIAEIVSPIYPSIE